MTAVYYSAAFNLANLNAASSLGTVTFRHAGETDIVITLGTLQAADANSVLSSWFWHFFETTTFTMVGYDPSATVRYPHFSVHSLGRILYQTVRAAQTSLGWPESDFLCSWVETQSGVTDPHYVMTNGSGFTYQFSTLAGAALFGHGSTSASSTATTHTLLTSTPSLVVVPSSQGISATGDLDALLYEPEGVASHVVADDGTGTGNARMSSYFHCNWLQQFETPEKMYRAYAEAGHPTTFQHLLEHCRSYIPFYVAHGFGSAPKPQYPVFVLRADGNFFKPQSASLANHVQLHHAFRTIAMGSLQTPT